MGSPATFKRAKQGGWSFVLRRTKSPARDILRGDLVIGSRFLVVASISYCGTALGVCGGSFFGLGQRDLDEFFVP